MSTLPRLGVVLDFGAASPLGILASARGLCEVVFLYDGELPYPRAHAEELAALATVCDLAGCTTREAAGRVGQLGLAALVTFSETQLTRTAALARACGIGHSLSPDAAQAVTDKLLQRQLLAAAGVEVTRSRLVQESGDVEPALEHVGLPAVLKPRSGAASAFTCQVDSAGQAHQRLSEFQDRSPGPERAAFVLEELLVGEAAAAGKEWGDYVSIESVVQSGQVRHVEVTGKFPLAPPFRETGYVVPSTLAEQLADQVRALTTAAVLALGIHDGVTHTEIKLTPTGPRVIEVNGRLGGYVSELIRRARGFDLVRAALATALGQRVEIAEPRYRRHTFAYFLTPPMDRRRLSRLDGVDQLSALPGIHTVELTKQVGDPIDWHDGTLAYLGIVHGSAADHDDVLDLVATIERTLLIDYD